MRLPSGVVKLTMDGCSKDNLGMTTSGSILRDHRGAILVAFGSFLSC